jgi:hypothetical protein
MCGSDPDGLSAPGDGRSGAATDPIPRGTSTGGVRHMVRQGRTTRVLKRGGQSQSGKQGGGKCPPPVPVTVNQGVRQGLEERARF